jgi:hypothetical protein
VLLGGVDEDEVFASDEILVEVNWVWGVWG